MTVFFDGDAAARALLTRPSRALGNVSNVPERPSVIETGHRPSLDDRCDYNRSNRNVPHAVTE